MNMMESLKARRTLRRLAAVLAAGGVSMLMMGEALAAEPEVKENAAAEAASAAAAEEPKAYQMEDIVVTAERVPTKKMDTPANVSVITAKEIEDNHYVDVTEALSHINGVIVSRQGSFDNVLLNGDERVVVLVDGRRLNNDQGLPTGDGRVDLRMIPSMKNIERIEVVKGGGSTLYGADAVGGVINIITKRGKKLETTLDANLGSWGTYNYEITNQGSEGKTSWFLTGGWQKRNHARMKLHGETVSPKDSDIDNNSFSLRLDHDLSSDESDSLRFVFEHKTKHENQYYNIINNTGGQDDMRTDVFNNLELSYHFKENQKNPGFLRVFQNYRASDVTSHFTTKLRGVDYQNGWQLGKNNRLVAGAEYHQSISANDGDAVNSSKYDDKTLRSAAVYLEDTWKFDDKWSLVPGVRFDHHNKYGNHWIPRISVNYNANDKTQVYASYGRVFHAPKADDLYWFQIDTWGTGYYGNPDLKAETGVTANIGINHRFNDDMSIGFNYFETRLSDAISWVYDGMTNSTSPVNKNREHRRGLELTFRHKLKQGWSYDLGYSYLNQKSTNAAGEIGYDGANRMPNGYRLGIHYDSGAWHANLLGTFVTGMDRDFYLRRRYALIDFNLSYDVTEQMKIYFKALNLTNQEYSAYQSNWGNAYPGLGRFFQLGVTYSF